MAIPPPTFVDEPKIPFGTPAGLEVPLGTAPALEDPGITAPPAYPGPPEIASAREREGVFSGPFEPYSRFLMEFDASAHPNPRVLRAIQICRATTVHAVPPDARIRDGGALLEQGEWGGIYRCTGREVLVLSAHHQDALDLTSVAGRPTWGQLAHICSEERAVHIAVAATELANRFVEGVTAESLLYVCPLVFVTTSRDGTRVCVSSGCVPRNIRFPEAHVYDLVIPSASKSMVWMVPRESPVTRDQRPSAEQIECISALAGARPYLPLDHGQSMLVDPSTLCPEYERGANESLAWALVASKVIPVRQSPYFVRTGMTVTDISLAAKKFAQDPE